MSLMTGGGDIWLPGQLLEVPWLEGCPFCVLKVGNGDESGKADLLRNPDGGCLMVNAEERVPRPALLILETRWSPSGDETFLFEVISFLRCVVRDGRNRSTMMGLNPV